MAGVGYRASEGRSLCSWALKEMEDFSSGLGGGWGAVTDGAQVPQASFSQHRVGGLLLCWSNPYAQRAQRWVRGSCGEDPTQGR